MTEEKTTKSEKESAGSCPPAMTGYKSLSVIDQIKNLSKNELFQLANNQGAFFCVTQRDINRIKAESKTHEASKLADEAQAEIDKYTATDVEKWFKAHKKFDRAMKMYVEVSELYIL